MPAKVDTRTRSQKWGLSQKQVDFVEWLCTPKAIRVPKTQNEWGAENNVHPRTLGKWKDELDFKRAWDRRLTELQVDPENLEAVMDALLRKATSGSEKAIQMWMEVYRQFRPAPEPEVQEQTALSELSDDELAALLADEVAGELQRRESGSDG